MPTPEQELEIALYGLINAALQRGQAVGSREAPGGTEHPSEVEIRNRLTEIRRLFAARDCGHPEAHCPVCSGSVEQCREFCRSAAEV